MEARVTLDSPAIFVMTDLRQVTTITIDPNAGIEAAMTRMRESNVRLLLVTDPNGNVTGVITATDIQGEKPMQFQKDWGVRDEELQVSDIMTPRSQLEVMQLPDVSEAKVGDVVATLKCVGRRHALAIADDTRTATSVIRGISSATRIGKQLGETVDPIGVG